MNKPYRVWYVPQIPMPAFTVEVDSVRDALLVKGALEGLSLYEYENHVKPDYSDASGVSQWNYEDQEWDDMDNEELREAALNEGVDL